MRARIPGIVVVLALAAMGCGGGSGAGGAPVAVGVFPARYASAWCGLMQRCCIASGGVAATTCAADTEARVAGIGTKATADGATWDAAAAGECLAGIARLDCGVTDPVALRAALDKCDDTWKGVVPPGGACMTYASCAEPTVGNGAVSGASCVNSACVQVVRLPVGAPCASAAATTVGCDPYLATCVAGACVALPSVGEACTDACSAGLRCGAAGKCTAPAPMGQACAVDSDCASDKCSSGKCASAFAEDGCTLP